MNIKNLFKSKFGGAVDRGALAALALVVATAGIAIVEIDRQVSSAERATHFKTAQNLAIAAAVIFEDFAGDLTNSPQTIANGIQLSSVWNEKTTYHLASDVKLFDAANAVNDDILITVRSMLTIDQTTPFVKNGKDPSQISVSNTGSEPAYNPDYSAVLITPVCGTAATTCSQQYIAANANAVDGIMITGLKVKVNLIGTNATAASTFESPGTLAASYSLAGFVGKTDSDGGNTDIAAPGLNLYYVKMFDRDSSEDVFAGALDRFKRTYHETHLKANFEVGVPNANLSNMDIVFGGFITSAANSSFDHNGVPSNINDGDHFMSPLDLGTLYTTESGRATILGM